MSKPDPTQFERFGQYVQARELSYSTLKHAVRSAAHFKTNMLQPIVRTSAMIFGSAFHTYVLQRPHFELEYLVLPEEITDKRSKEYKALMRERSPLDKRDIITHEEFARIQAMDAVLWAEEEIATWLEHSQKEVWIKWKDPTSDLSIRGRCDMLMPQLGFILDVKTTQDARYRQFQCEIINRLYHLQGAMYIDGANRSIGEELYKSFVAIAIEPEEPHGVISWLFDEALVDTGRALFRDALHTVNEAIEKDRWSCYCSKLQQIYLPAWGGSP